MKVEVEIKRAEQSWDLSTRQQQNYLVLDVLGVEARVPCTEEQLVQVLATITGGQSESYSDEPGDEEPAEDWPDETAPIAPPATFQPVEVPQPQITVINPRKLEPIQRPPRGDDVGIAQG